MVYNVGCIGSEELVCRVMYRHLTFWLEEGFTVATMA
jgi:hypothetical protein